MMTTPMRMKVTIMRCCGFICHKGRHLLPFLNSILRRANSTPPFLHQIIFLIAIWISFLILVSIISQFRGYFTSKPEKLFLISIQRGGNSRPLFLPQIIHTPTHIHTTHTHIRTYKHIHIHTYTHTHLHTYTHTRIHTYTHTHILQTGQ